jgi:hypothetical protein
MISIQNRIRLERSGLMHLVESFGEHNNFSSLVPYHSFHTDDGHKIDIHIFNNPNGKHAVYFNKNLNDVVKLVHFSHNHEIPSKRDLEKDDTQENQNIHENEIKLDNDSAGKISEHSAVMHMIGHMHKQKKTFGSEQHKSDISSHEEEIKKLSNGKNQKQVLTRVAHGRAMADAALETLKMDHGPKVKIHAVGHTANKGDIGRFTNGKHNDKQENPSDMAVKVSNSEKSENKKEHHYHGFSLKSSEKSSQITAKNPAIHFDGMLDHSSRKFDAENISRAGLKSVHREIGHTDISAADRGRMIDAERKKLKEEFIYEAAKPATDLEAKANELARPVKHQIAKELHDHVHHLLTNVGPEGHHMVGNMLSKHLTPQTSMPWVKVHAKGDSEEKVKATVTHGSESPLNKIFKNKKTRYAVTHHGERVTFHKVEKNGTLTALAHYSPKTKSNAFKSDVHGWNVVPANTHSKN